MWEIVWAIELENSSSPMQEESKSCEKNGGNQFYNNSKCFGGEI